MTGDPQLRYPIEYDAEVWTLLDTLRDGAPGPAIGREDEHGGLEENDHDTGNGGGSLVGVYRCVHCQADEVGLHNSVFVCARCDTVLMRFLDSSAEWRYYGSDDNRSPVDPSRCGPPQNDLIPMLGSTVCGAPGRNAVYGAARVIQKYQMWNAMTYKERNLMGVFDVLNVNASMHGLPHCILEESKTLYKRISETKIFRGENRHALVACSIYMACKTNNVPRSLKEIAAMFDIKPTSLSRACKQFQELLHLNVASSTPDDFVSRFCSRLGMDDTAVSLVRRIVQRADEMYVVSESTPPSVVASAIYMCSVVMNIGISKKRISELCQTSQVTINKCYKKLMQRKYDILDEDSIDTTTYAGEATIKSTAGCV